MDARPLCGAYALELLDDSLLAGLAQHLQTCLECWEVCTAVRRVAGAIGYAAPPAALPPGMKERLFIRLDEPTVADVVPPEPLPALVGPSRPDPWRRRLAGGLLGVATAVTTWTYVALTGHQAVLQARIAEAVVQRDRALARVQRLETQARVATALPATDVRSASLEGGRRMPFARARLSWQLREQSWLLSAENLAPLRPGQVYVLWAVCGAMPVHLGVLGPLPATGPALVKVFLPKLPAKPVAAMVTVETATPVTKPGGDVALMGLL
ncbi:MAG: anti-sigma factor [Candidatus Sericytochromatia bacterium]|nr:anti-sigma factor [Candidatus Sericytochromatia bacterium]